MIVWGTVPQSFIAELTVVHPDLPLAPTIAEASDVSIRLESQPITDPDSPILFYSVEGADLRDFESELADDHTVTDWQVTIEFDDCWVYQIQLSPKVKLLTPTLTILGVRVLAVESAERGWKIRVHAPDKESLGSFWKYCRAEEIEFELEKIYSSGSANLRLDSVGVNAQLTDRQREVARTAARMGYYEEEGASAEEVAAELGIAPSTLSTHLRRIIAKVFDNLFDDRT